MPTASSRATTNCVLATIRADGSPRISGIDPFFRDGQLWIGSMPDSRKGADLRRDPRMALHGIPWESRKVKEGATDPGDGDVKVTGRAVELADSEARPADPGGVLRRPRRREPARRRRPVHDRPRHGGRASRWRTTCSSSTAGRPAEGRKTVAASP